MSLSIASSSRLRWLCPPSDSFPFPCHQSSLREFVWQCVGIPMHAPARAPWVRPARVCFPGAGLLFDGVLAAAPSRTVWRP